MESSRSATLAGRAPRLSSVPQASVLVVRSLDGLLEGAEERSR